MSTANALLTAMDGYLSKIRSEKQAGLKKVAGGTGDGSDPSTHPVMKVDNNTTPVTEGARGKENTADIKKDVGSAGVHGQEDSSAADKANPVDSIGTQKQGPDEVKGNVPTPKKPDTLVLGDKHASLSALQKRAATILENIQKVVPATEKTAAAVTPAPAAATPAATPSKEDLQKQAAAQYPEDAENGYIAAQTLAQALGLVKSAEDQQTEVETQQLINDRLANIIKMAEMHANNAVDYIEGMVAGQQEAQTKKAALAKKAEGEMVAPEEMAGAVPPEGEAPGGGMEGAPPPEGMGGGEGGESGGPEIEALAQILAQHGISLEELMQALQGGGEAGGDAAGLEGAGAPPPPPPEADGMGTEKAARLKKVAAYTKNKKAIHSFLSKVAGAKK